MAIAGAGRAAVIDWLGKVAAAAGAGAGFSGTAVRCASCAAAGVVRSACARPTSGGERFQAHSAPAVTSSASTPPATKAAADGLDEGGNGANPIGEAPCLGEVARTGDGAAADLGPGTAGFVATRGICGAVIG